MPCSKSSCYNFTFRPTIEEFDEYHKDFVDKFTDKFNKYKYIISYEKGKSDIHNHIQGFIDMSKEVRSDNLRKTFNKIISEYNLKNKDIAMKVKPVVRDAETCAGYILKEYEDIENNEFILYNGYSIEYLLELREKYLKLSLDKKQVIDKVRVNIRNLPEIFRNYYNLHKSDIDETIEGDINNLDNEDVKKILLMMGQTDYYVLPIILSRDFDKIVKYLRLYIKNELIYYFDEDYEKQDYDPLSQILA